MYFFGVLFVVLGGWMIDSGIEGRHPVATVEALIQSGPSNWSQIKDRQDLKLGHIPAVSLPNFGMQIAKGIAKGGESAVTTVPKAEIGLVRKVWNGLFG